MVGSEVYSSEVKKTEVLMENFRRAIGESSGTSHEVTIRSAARPAAAAAAAAGSASPLRPAAAEA